MERDATDERTTDGVVNMSGRVRARQPGRWWVEAGGLIALYAGYTASRGLMHVDPTAALQHAQRLVDWEDRLGLGFEVSANGWLTGAAPLAVLACYFYATLHYLVTPAVLVVLRRRSGAHYVWARDALVLATAVGLFCYWVLPVAPPRLLDGQGFQDTMAAFSGYGWWGSAASAPKGLGGLTNQYAALPSLHVGWALWCAWAVQPLLRRRATRWAAWLYPAMTTAVVVGTGNHYLLDAVGGALVLALGVLGVPAVERALAGVRSRRPDQESRREIESAPYRCPDDPRSLDHLDAVLELG